MIVIPYWAWLVAGLLLLILEMVTTTFVVSFFGIGALIAYAARRLIDGVI